jgi:hypothetical protein
MKESFLHYSARNLRRPKSLGSLFLRSVAPQSDALFRLTAETFGITFPNRVTVVSSADKTLLITAPGFHELKVSSREQIRRLHPRVPRSRNESQSLRASARSSGPFDLIILSRIRVRVGKITISDGNSRNPAINRPLWG